MPGLPDTGALCDGVWRVRDALVNFYVVQGPEGLVCVDAGWRPRHVARAFGALGIEMNDVAAVLLTHTHWDHARCAGIYPNAQVYVGAGETPPLLAPKPARPPERIEDEGCSTAAGLPVRALPTPGHTDGSISYLVDGRFLFTGDTLRLRGGVARPFPRWLNRDNATIRRSIQRLAMLDRVEWLLTAHSGATSDVRGAFRPWRQAPAVAPGKGDAP